MLASRISEPQVIPEFGQACCVNNENHPLAGPHTGFYPHDFSVPGHAHNSLTLTWCIPQPYWYCLFAGMCHQQWESPHGNPLAWFDAEVFCPSASDHAQGLETRANPAWKGQCQSFLCGHIQRQRKPQNKKHCLWACVSVPQQIMLETEAARPPNTWRHSKLFL